MPDYIGDYHIHTRFSCDSEAELNKICETAISRRLPEIAITDHLDFGPDDPPGYFRPVEYAEAIQRCREFYNDRLIIRTGVEIGEPHIFSEKAKAVLSKGEFDFVIGSAHYADMSDSSSDSADANGLQCAWKEAFFEQPLHTAYESYFRQVMRLAREGDFDVLGHLDLVKRDAHKFGKPYDGPEPYSDMIRTTLRTIVERGKGIEINTSSLYKGTGMSEPCPSLEILTWYREMGGEILTIGSDAHTADKVGAHFDLAYALAEKAGFRRLATYERRRIQWKQIHL